MIWLTWRQSRIQAIVAAAALAVFAILLAITGPHLASLYNSMGFASCHASGDCGTLSQNFVIELKAGTLDPVLFYLGAALLYAVPVLAGVFWGAPLITREFEAGTFRLAWNQSVTRTRWMVVKLLLLGVGAMVTEGLFSLMVSWWASPIDRATGFAGANGQASLNRLEPLMFGARGITPIGYAAFAFALGVTAGALIRRTVPAMAVTLVLFAAIQVIMPNVIRPHLISPESTTSAFNSANITELSVGGSPGSGATSMKVLASVNKPGAWVLSNESITPSGKEFTGPPTQACMSNTRSFQACQNSIGALHLRQVVTFQPASRYWPLQWIETGIYLALAVILAGFCIWWVRRRTIT